MIPQIVSAVEKLARQIYHKRLASRIETYRFVYADESRSHYRAGNQETIGLSDAFSAILEKAIAVEFFVNGHIVSRNTLIQVDMGDLLESDPGTAHLIGYRIGENELAQP